VDAQPASGIPSSESTATAEGSDAGGLPSAILPGNKTPDPAVSATPQSTPVGHQATPGTVSEEAPGGSSGASDVVGGIAAPPLPTVTFGEGLEGLLPPTAGGTAAAAAGPPAPRSRATRGPRPPAGGGPSATAAPGGAAEPHGSEHGAPVAPGGGLSRDRRRFANSVLLGFQIKVAGGLDHKVAGEEQQVEMLINQATNPHLLSQMYEGWAPWI
jgi:hypothetical protein